MNTFALVGNANCGKSTFFNSATNADEHVGNWHGVTVSYKEKRFKKNGVDCILTDLPGTYSLSPYSFEEAVTRDYLLSHKNCKVINIVDGNNLERNLLLTLELLEADMDVCLCINMANELAKDGVNVDVKKLQKSLGIEVFLIDAQSKKQCGFVIESTCKNKTKYQNARKFDYANDILYQIDDILGQKTAKTLTKFQKLKIAELDEFTLESCKFEAEYLKNVKQKIESARLMEKLIQLRFDIIKDILKNCVSFQGKKKVYGFCRFDKFATHKIWAVPLFLIAVLAIFWLTFGVIGTSLCNALSDATQKVLIGPIFKFLSTSNANQFAIDFVCNALCGSIVALASFLPQVVLMFLGLNFLEDSGYMSRIAFTFEDFLKKVGLSGKSVFAILMSFGCSTTATLACRNLEDKNSKIKTAMLTPYVSCSAKLPIYFVIVNAFFPHCKFLIVATLYVLGIIFAFFVSYFFNKKALKSKEVSFVMELPRYRWPSAKRIAKNIFANTKQFLLRVGTVLLSFSCIIWLLQNCNFKLQYNTGPSMLESLSNLIAPIFAPLGFGSAGAVSALLCGFVAKEIIVSTIGIINKVGGTGSVEDISKSLLLSSSAICFSAPSSLSFLTFSLLYLPCVSTVSVMIKEIGKKWTAIACAVQFLLSYAVSFAVYRISLTFEAYGFWGGLVSALAFSSIVACMLFAKRLLKKHNMCKYCPHKNACNNKDAIKSFEQ